jgi:hypothetical protein
MGDISSMLIYGCPLDAVIPVLFLTILIVALIMYGTSFIIDIDCDSEVDITLMKIMKVIIALILMRVVWRLIAHKFRNSRERLTIH